ncbi:MAG: hypothetical protein IJ756_05845 [Paludibacteraceae bacterium]|nr:hypothetical protein [Paludibacteraceae bacterium]
MKQQLLYIDLFCGAGGTSTGCEGINIGKGKPEWGAHPVDEVFIIKLGEVLL